MPSPFAAFARSLAISAPSCLQGVHCPHDSIARKRETPAATLTTSVPSAITMYPAEPRPLPMPFIPS